ncbi:MAG: dienelactone hydrolase family protein [Gemmatimonadaceae bacterium]
MADGPHQGQPVFAAGDPLESAHAAMVMVHGRGADANDILGIASALEIPGFAYLAPEANGNSWYPNSFLAPIESNEPGITSALALIGSIIDRIGAAGIPLKRVMLLGFSQGACLSAEYAARNPARYGGVACLSGGLIGPDETPRTYPGTFDGTPIFLGCSDVDFHIPAARVKESAEVLGRMHADVTMKFYPGMGHTVNDDELDAVSKMMREVSVG